MKSPQVEYLKKNPKAVAACLAIFVAVGVPGAASLLSCVNMMGAAEMAMPLLILLAEPMAEMLV